MEKGRGFSAHVHVSLKSTPEHLPGGRTGTRLVSSCAGQGLEQRAEPKDTDNISSQNFFISRKQPA